MTVKYKAVVHDIGHTLEQQVYLLALAAEKAWRIWIGSDGKQSMHGINPELDIAMREVYAQLYQTDVFMGGVHHND